MLEWSHALTLLKKFSGDPSSGLEYYGRGMPQLSPVFTIQKACDDLVERERFVRQSRPDQLVLYDLPSQVTDLD